MKSMKLNTLSMLMMRILNIAFPLLTGPYIARILNKTDYGYYNSIATIVSFFIPVATFGIYNYGIRAISHVKDDRKQVNKVFSKLFYITAFSSIITYLVYMLGVVALVKDPLQLYLYFIFGFQILSQMLYIEWINEAFENYSFIFYKTLFIRIAMLVGIFGLVRNENDIVAYTWVSTIVSILNYLISFWWIKRRLKFEKVKIKEITSIIPSLFALLILANANMLYSFLDRLFLSMGPYPEYTSYYTISYNIVMLTVGVISGAVSVIVPRLGYYLGNNKKEEYKNLVYDTSKMFYFFVVPIAIGLFVLGNQSTLLYAGEKYVDAGIYTMMFTIRSLIWCTDIILGTHVIFINGFEKRLTFFTLSGGILNLILNSLVFFLKISDPFFYILTTIIAESFVIVLYSFFIHKHQLVQLRKIFKNLLKYLLLSLGFIAIAVLAQLVYPYQGVINGTLFKNIVVIIVSSVIYYIVVLWIIKDAAFTKMVKEIGRFVPIVRKKKNEKD